MTQFVLAWHGDNLDRYTALKRLEFDVSIDSRPTDKWSIDKWEWYRLDWTILPSLVRRKLKQKICTGLKLYNRPESRELEVLKSKIRAIEMEAIDERQMLIVSFPFVQGSLLRRERIS